MTRKLMRCEVCWEDNEMYREAILIGLVGHGNSELAVCEEHFGSGWWYVPYVEYDEE